MTPARWRVRVVAACVALAVCAPAAVRAQSKTGTALGEFLLIEPSARLAGMGNAAAGLDEGIDAVWFNAATLAMLDHVSVDFSHLAWFGDIAIDYAAVAIPLGKWGSGMASVTSLRSGDMDVRTVAQPLGTGERFSVSDIAIGLGYGRQITDRFAVGGQVRWLQETIWLSSYNSVVFDIGTVYRVSDRGLRIGSSLTNVGTRGRFAGDNLRVTFDQDPTRQGDNGSLPAEQFTGDFPLPVTFRVGLGLPVRLTRDAALRLGIDALHPSENTESVNAGFELAYRHAIAVRAGWQEAFARDTELGPTAGAGVQGRLEDYGYRFDYAWADHQRLGATHRFTATLTF